MDRIERLLDEGVGVFHAVQAGQAAQRKGIADLELAVVALTQVVREFLDARAADREMLREILKACTRDGGGELAETIKHMEAAISRMAFELRALHDALAPVLTPEDGRTAAATPGA